MRCFGQADRTYFYSIFKFCQQVVKAFLKSTSWSSNGKISSPPKSTGNVRKPPGDLYRLIHERAYYTILFLINKFNLHKHLPYYLGSVYSSVLDIWWAAFTHQPFCPFTTNIIIWSALGLMDTPHNPSFLCILFTLKFQCQNHVDVSLVIGWMVSLPQSLCPHITCSCTMWLQWEGRITVVHTCLLNGVQYILLMMWSTLLLSV